ncbi:MAG TPA: hypothetical protein VE288_18595 [Rubrobacteraceae bacterium]|nr:hypothetical protein [Rubrobacteraceae bacterium]
MALDDFVETEVGVAVAATAAIASPRVRRLLRQGAVYGLAGALIAGDRAASVARGAGPASQKAAFAAGEAVSSFTSGAAVGWRRATSATAGVVQDAASRARQSVRGEPAESNREDIRSIIRESVRRSAGPQT